MESVNSPFQITLVLTKHLYIELMLTQQVPEWLGQPELVLESRMVWKFHFPSYGAMGRANYVFAQLVRQYPIRSWAQLTNNALKTNIHEYGNGSLAP